MARRRDWRSEPGIRAWSAFLRAHAAAVRRIDLEIQRRTNLPLAWYDVLLELDSASERRMRMLDLGEAAVLSRTRVSRLVDELVAAGLVVRQPNPADRRSSYAAITPEGRARLRRAAPVYLEAIRTHFVGALQPGQVAVVEAAMSAIIDHRSPPSPAE